MGEHMCKKCGGMVKLGVGALLLLNGFVWPLWLGFDGWMKWFGVLLVILGAMKLWMPNSCKACKAK